MPPCSYAIQDSNVVELYSRLIKDDTQLTYYNSGIGTYVRESKTSIHYWKQAFDNAVDMAIAWFAASSSLCVIISLLHSRNFKKIVLNAYQWLSEKYRPGDRIYLFGKSYRNLNNILLHSSSQDSLAGSIKFASLQE
jgi:uncharacterized protein (DUF2235 family)